MTPPNPTPQVTDGCGSPLHRLRSPLHSGPGSPAGGSFCLEPPGLRRSVDEDEAPPSPLARYRPLHNAASHEGLAAASSSPPRSAPSSDSSPSFVRRYPRAEPHSEGERRWAWCPLRECSGTAAVSPSPGMDRPPRDGKDGRMQTRRGSKTEGPEDRMAQRVEHLPCPRPNRCGNWATQAQRSLCRCGVCSFREKPSK